MFHFGNNNNKPVYGALFDVGSGTVGVAIAEFDSEKPIPHIIFSHRMDMRITEHNAEKEVLLRKVRESILSAALVLSQDGLKALSSHDKHGKISRLLVTCSSPWSYNIARTVEYKDDEPFKVSKAIIEDLVHSAEETIFSDIKKKDKNAAKDYNIVERVSINISINDYSVEDPIDLKGSKVSLSHITGLIPKKIILSLNEVQEKLFGSTEMKTHTYMLIMYCILRDIFPRLSNLSIVDVTAEAVEFGIVDNGILVENDFFNYGSSTLIREVSKLTKKPIADVEATLIDYPNSKEEQNILTPIIDKYIDEYAKGIENIMDQKIIPDDLVLTTHRKFEPLFKYILDRAFKKVTNKKRTILTIDPSLVEEISTGTNDDVYLALEARFFHKLHGCGEIEDN